MDYDIQYCILNFCTFFQTLATLVICAQCNKKIKFERAGQRGIGFKVSLECECETVHYIPSSPLVNRAFEINRRMVFAMRMLGVGLGGLNMFCGLMDIGQGLCRGTYYLCLENIFIASKAVYEICLLKAVKEEQELQKEENPASDPTLLTVSGDGTWKKRGFSSLYGATTLIGKYSKKVLDSVVKSSLCQACKNWKAKSSPDEDFESWYESHEEKCTANHTGSSGAMEVNAVKEMFSASYEKYGVKYQTYIGDGDSKTFKAIIDTDPYNGDPIVTKKECIAHVQKRMGTRLRKAKKENKGIGGKGGGKLTDKVISELTTYYGLAIRRHSDSVEDMKKAIWATYFHKASTDNNPQHNNCPPGASSWCAYQKAAAEGTLDSFHHTYPPLNDKVLEVIKPIYEALSSDELLERCTGGETQNNNESFNSLLWTFAPKHIHSGAHTVEIANYLATCIFNQGFMYILKVMGLMGVKIGSHAYQFAISRDDERIERSEAEAASTSKEGRTARRAQKAQDHSFFEMEEGVLYGAGIAD